MMYPLTTHCSKRVCWALFIALITAMLTTNAASSADPSPLYSAGRQTAGYATRVVSPPDRVFVSGEDQSALWRQTVSRVSAEAPAIRIRSPDPSQSPPVDGLIETSWVGMPNAKASPNARRRAVVHFTPEEGGAWLETETAFEMTMPEPLPLPSATESSSFFSSRQAPVQQVAMLSTDGGAANDNSIELAQFTSSGFPTADGVAPLPGSDGIMTMPPAYPNSLSPFSFPTHPALSRAVRKVGSDYKNFYSCDSLVCVTAAFGAGALMANTGFDTTMQTAWQTSVAPTGFGHFLGGTKPLGEGRYELAVWGTAAVTGLVFDELPAGNVVGEWGSRSLRMFVVGAPPLYVLQKVTGASRPSDGYGSQWHFNNDNNGVSGHAFIGAIPFLAAAEMVENPWAKGTLYVCSTFCGLSRVDANAHYPSQVFLGWYLAFASSLAVEKTETKFAGMYLRAVPMAMNNGTGMAIEGRW